MCETVFEKYGGFANVRKVVSAFYDGMLASDELARFFQNSDMRRLIDHQTKFIASLMGGPAAFSDDVLQRVHAHLGIRASHFAEMTEILRETLEDFGVEDRDTDHICRELAKREHLIVVQAPVGSTSAPH